jgi:hypothetical protein
MLIFFFFFWLCFFFFFCTYICMYFFSSFVLRLLSILGLLLFVSVCQSFFFRKLQSSDMCVCVSDYISVSVLRVFVCMMMSSCSIINISFHTSTEMTTKRKQNIIFLIQLKSIGFCETRTERSVEVLRVKIWTHVFPH